MTTDFEKNAEEAGRLPDTQKLALAGLLLEWADRDEDAGVGAAWGAEIHARIKAVDEGRVVGGDHEEVLREIDRRLST